MYTGIFSILDLQALKWIACLGKYYKDGADEASVIFLYGICQCSSFVIQQSSYVFPKESTWRRLGAISTKELDQLEHQLQMSLKQIRSTKVLPVMVMGAFIPSLRRKYPLHEYVSALFLVVGLILFTLADAHTSPNFSMIGVVMVSGALVVDSFLGNLQEAIFTMNPETTQMEMFFCSTVVGLPFLIPPMLVLVFEAMATFIGQVSVLSLVAIFGAATTAMVWR